MFILVSMIFDLLLKRVSKGVINNLNKYLHTLIMPDDPQIPYSAMKYFLGTSKNYESIFFTSSNSFYHYEMSLLC